MHPALSAVLLLFLILVPFPQYSPESVPLRLITSEAASMAAAPLAPKGAAVQPPTETAAVPVPKKASKAKGTKRSATLPGAASVRGKADPLPATTTASHAVSVPEAKPIQDQSPEEPDAYVTRLEYAVHELVNAERSKRGIGPLRYDATLAGVADGHSADMLQKEYFAHTNQDGCDPFCRIKAGGYSWQTAGENIFWMEGYDLSLEETAAMIVKSWMDSPGHRENILNAAFKEEGIGVAVSGKKVYATENFGTPR